jgi:hypothetical protein
MERAVTTPLSRAEQAVTEARFVVEQYGPRWFVITDTVSQLSYDSSFTRKGAQHYADLRNASSSKGPRP